MKSADIEPGAVYAFTRDRDMRYARMMPVVFLVQPGKDSIWRERWAYSKPGTDSLEFEKSQFTTVRKGAYHNRAAGYPVVMGDGVTPELLAYAASLKDHGVDFESFKAATSRAIRVPDSAADLAYTVFSHMAGVLGPWDEVMAQREAAKVAQEQADKARAEYKADQDARWAVVCTELGRVLDDGKPLSTSRIYSGTLHLSLDSCEELVSVLSMAKNADV